MSASTGEGASGLSLDPRVLEAAFSVEVMVEGNNSELLEIGPGRVAVIRVLERQESRPLTLDESRDRVRATLQADARAAKAQELGATILAALKAGGDLDQVASDHGQTFGEPTEASPASPGPLDPDTQRSLFSTPAPDDEARPAVVGVPGAGASYQVLAVLKVNEADASPAEEEARVARGELESALGTAAFQALMRGIRDRAEVRIFTETLNSDSM